MTLYTISSKGSTVDYYGFYHFLEGLLMYDKWEDNIDYKSKHHRLIPEYNPWCDKKAIVCEFLRLFDKFQDNTFIEYLQKKRLFYTTNLRLMLKVIDV